MAFIGVILLLVFYLFLLAYFVFSYVMTSLSLMTIAKRRGIKNAWLAWIPVGNYWILGSITSEYDGRNGIKRRWDKVLLTLGIIAAACVVVFLAAVVVVVITAIGSDAYMYAIDAVTPMIIGPAILFFVAYFGLVLTSVAVSFVALVCYYKLFESTVPEKSLKYFLLSMLCPFAAPICLFLCRNKGYELPPQNMCYVPQPTEPINSGETEILD